TETLMGQSKVGVLEDNLQEFLNRNKQHVQLWQHKLSDNNDSLSDSTSVDCHAPIKLNRRDARINLFTKL
ncbi:hypothetical protein HDV01_002571, partial [Terramyces sp. JEL0728]